MDPVSLNADPRACCLQRSLDVDRLQVRDPSA
jgi:hypothetical protein